MCDWHKLNRIGVIGLGRTGCSVISYWVAQNKHVVAFEEDAASPSIERVSNCFPQVEIKVGALADWDWSALELTLDLLVVSPGVDLRHPVLVNWRSKDKPLCGDIELFCQRTSSSIIAVTGSNGKTTVATMVAEALALSGKTVELAGNIGRPVLELLDGSESEYTVLELSSFQLETVSSLQQHVAVVTNYSPDHLDRYGDYSEYVNMKNRVYRRAKIAVVNVDQSECINDINAANVLSFSLQGEADLMLRHQGARQVFMHGEKVLCGAEELLLKGGHYFQNALILFSIMVALRLPVKGAIELLRRFSGLSHRCQYVLTRHHVRWYNDSKATNEGATIAAIRTIKASCAGQLILIAGGDAKGGDFVSLKEVVAHEVSHVIVFGKDKGKLRDVFSSITQLTVVNDLDEAVSVANELSIPGDAVLLSPACSSLDMFDNYEHRGQVFCGCVEGLAE